MFIVQINTEKSSDGCFQRTFDSLDDEARAFIKSSAASFRRGAAPEIKCVATILRNGSALRDARLIDC